MFLFENGRNPIQCVVRVTGNKNSPSLEGIFFTNVLLSPQLSFPPPKPLLGEVSGRRESCQDGCSIIAATGVSRTLLPQQPRTGLEFFKRNFDREIKK